MRKKPVEKTRLPSLTKKAPNFEKYSTEMHNESDEMEVIKLRGSREKQDLIVEGLFNSIHEFLVKRNYVKTVETFQKEMLRQPDRVQQKKKYDASLIEVR
jgi:hypothetical protein